MSAQKIPLASLLPWVGQYRGASTQSGQYVQITALLQHESSLYFWSIIVPGILHHTEYAVTAEEAQYAADRYLEEHFELPVSIEDKLAAAEKRIAELEAKTPGSWFELGQKVSIAGDRSKGVFPVEGIDFRLNGRVLYWVDGRAYFLTALEPA